METNTNINDFSYSLNFSLKIMAYNFLTYITRLYYFYSGMRYVFEASISI